MKIAPADQPYWIARYYNFFPFDDATVDAAETTPPTQCYKFTSRKGSSCCLIKIDEDDLDV